MITPQEKERIIRLRLKDYEQGKKEGRAEMLKDVDEIIEELAKCRDTSPHSIKQCKRTIVLEELKQKLKEKTQE